jgi:hypothetical protein
MTSSLSRRQALARALGGVALPLLSGLPRPAAGAPAPRRLVMMITPNGNVMEHYWPGADGAWKRILEPLAPMRHKLLVMRGLDLKGAPVGGGHGPDYPNLMTACGGGPISGPSIDQAIAAVLGKHTRLPSLELGVREFSHCSYKGPKQPIAPQTDPVRAYARIFGASSSGGADRQRELARLVSARRSIFDRVSADLEALSCALGREDRVKLEAHETSIRALEKRLAATTAATETGGAATCQRPKAPAYAPGDGGNRFFLQGDGSNAHFLSYGRMQLDNIVGAMACDLTRVATMQWDRSTSIMNINFAGGGVSGQFHGIGHSVSAGDRAKIAQVQRTFAQQFLHLITQMDAIKEGDRTLLDNSVVLWVNEQADGATHSRRDHGIVMAGSAGGVFKLGRTIDFKGAGHAGLYVAIANALGVPMDVFGDPQHGKGALAGLTG